MLELLKEYALDDIILHALNALILFLLVRQLLYKPVRKFMAARSEKIQASLDEAAEAEAHAKELKAEYEARIAQAEEEAREKALEITSAANESAKVMGETAENEARETIRRAAATAQDMHDKALAGMEQEVLDLSFDIATQVLRREARSGENLDMAKSYFQQKVTPPGEPTSGEG
ncbi:MAG: ATP synthase F0 subunit B [Oscillospiraceae bacterium]|jgi:F-type H+-transporting ATPase subunit b|nr:ATP synthase F0 subunit B [Oscillospiraceae bacterium]